LAPAFQFTTIDCPDTRLPITVARRLDPISQLFVTGQISKHQRDAAEAYATDLDAPSLRASSRGPSDIAGWRGRRADGYRKHSNRLAKANAALTPDQAKAVKAAMAGHKVAGTRQLTSALDALAVVYGLSTRTRH
jgi:hypothetical protein